MLSIFGKIIGDLVTARWFSDQTWTVNDGSVHLGLPHFIAIGVIITVWAFNILGIRPFVWLTYVCAACLMVPLIVFIVLPYLTGDWHASNLHSSFPGPWGGVKVALVYLFILAWSAYGTEICATFAPEYYDTKRDTALALKSASIFALLVFTLLPLGLGGVTGAPSADTAEGGFYVQAFQQVVGHTLVERVPDLLDRQPRAVHGLLHRLMPAGPCSASRDRA